MNRQNQENPPRPEKARVDSKGNSNRRYAVKDRVTTMTIAVFPSENACNIFDQKMKNAVKALGGKLLIQTTNFR